MTIFLLAATLPDLAEPHPKMAATIQNHEKIHEPLIGGLLIGDLDDNSREGHLDQGHGDLLVGYQGGGIRPRGLIDQISGLLLNVGDPEGLLTPRNRP